LEAARKKQKVGRKEKEDGWKKEKEKQANQVKR
jgi:hypothetical protein